MYNMALRWAAVPSGWDHALGGAAPASDMVCPRTRWLCSVLFLLVPEPGIWHTGKPAEQKLRALSLHTSDFHNLTDLARTHLGNPRLALQRPLGENARSMSSRNL